MRIAPPSRLRGLPLLALAVLLLPGLAAAGEAGLSDRDITVAVDTELLLDEGVDAQLIDVQTEDGVVTLTGTVESILSKERATTIVEAIRGVRAVINRITVRAPADRPDAAIEKDIQSALVMDPAADTYQLDVSVRDGEVTLSGRVDSWQEKRLAAHVVKGVRGVKMVRNRIEVRADADRPDAEIRADVLRRLQTDVRLDASLVEVTVSDGEVTLRGKVGSAFEKTRAYNDAWVAGVLDVTTDDLTVDPELADPMVRKTSNVTLGDKEIGQAVKDAFLYDPRIYSFNPEVEVEFGVVTLTGTVSNMAAKQAAAQDARNTVGVARVKNLIKVRPAEEVADETLAQRIRDALSRDPYVDRYEIAVSVENGKAFLYGTVDTHFERTQAGKVAATVDGVVAVRNNLSLTDRYEPLYAGRTDAQIESDIRDQLFWNFSVDADDIRISVENGVATLRGEVDSYYEHQEALDEAWQAGVSEVVDRLEVRTAAAES
jgi:osmotically-inducible protein OsmY